MTPPPLIPPSSTIIKFTPETVLATLTSYSNDWQRALDFYHYVSSPPHSFSHTPKTLATTIDILSKHFEFDRAFSLLPPPNSNSSFNPNHHPCFRALFNRLAAAHLVDDAISTFRRFRNDDLPSYYLLIDALCDHRHVAEAESLSLKAPDPPPFPADTKIHNIILRGWLKTGHFSRCRDFWQEMDRKGVEKDLHSYSIYMDFLSKSGKPWKAVRLYRDLLAKGWDLDVVVYNIVIQADGFTRGADMALRRFREMVDNGCQPNLVSVNTVIKMLCREGRVREGFSFMYTMMKKKVFEPNVITYHCFFRHCARPNEILWLFERMVLTGCRPRMDTYVMLMKKFGRWGFLRPVFTVWKKMEESGMSPDGFAYNAMIDALLEKGMVELARKYDEEMVAKGLAAKPRKEFGTKYLGGGGIGNDEDNAFSGIF